MIRRIAPSLVALAILPAAVIAWQQARMDAPSSAPGQSYRAPAADAVVSDADLRARGPEGLRTLLAEYDRSKDAGLLSRIDAVAGQRDAVWSRLYWYTDLEAAKSAARAEGKPILYLRLLGKLTDEYSCANSRFFRTVLYANESVSQLLRDRFVLVWESERPVPVVTIDYGDGRVLKRTITGNSIHYVLDAEGNVVDAVPGLYDPAMFANVLTAAIEPAASGSVKARAEHRAKSIVAIMAEMRRGYEGMSGVLPVADATTLLAGYTTAADAAVTTEAKRRVETRVLTAIEPGRASPAAAPNAADAGMRTASKEVVEAPVVQAIAAKPSARPDAADASRRAFSKTGVEGPLVTATVRPVTPEAGRWDELAAVHVGSVHLDANSEALMRSHNPAYADPAVFARALEQFRTSIAQDTVRNQYDFRVKIFEWLRRSPKMSLETLNTRVYSELFLTPRSDPWLGLKSEEVYSALSGDGCPAN